MSSEPAKALPLPSQRLHWTLAVLALLRERPMHPYEMRRLIRERHKEERLLIKPGSLYHAIAWLEKEKLIEARKKTRVGNRPERTVYRILKSGEKAFLAALQEMLAAPIRESSSFAVALDHTVHLQPNEVADCLDQRIQQLKKRLPPMDYVLKDLAPKIGRINLLEVEFERVQCQAELAWLQKLVAQLRSGQLAWNIQQILGWLREQRSDSKLPTSNSQLQNQKS